jgi:flagellar biosynthesis protein FlhF
MNLQTFKAPTMALALQQVKSAMGHDAVILHTRTYQLREWMGLRRREVVEVTAGRGLGGTGRRRAPAASGPPQPTLWGSPGDSMSGGPAILATPPKNPSPNGSVAGLALYAAQSKDAKLPATRSPAAKLPTAAPPAPLDPVANGKSLLGLPVAGNALILSVSQEVSALKVLVNNLVTEARHAASPKVPEALFDHYMNLVQNHVAEELALQIVRALPSELRPDQLARPECVRERLAEHIERLIPACEPLARRNADGPHVLVLIGPTGVGKTTTLAKLAANLKIKDKHKIGLITLDTYRISAVDQLRKYAEILQSPLRVVSTCDELMAAVASMRDLDYVLIDTAGRSPNDAEKLGELRELLACINPDDVHLVLSSTSCQSSVELACERFGQVRVDKIIFTKLDEAAHVGVVLNVIKNVKKSLSYITTGQNVPDDIEVGRGRVLAQRLLNPGGDGRGLSNERFEK